MAKLECSCKVCGHQWKAPYNPTYGDLTNCPNCAKPIPAYTFSNKHHWISPTNADKISFTTSTYNPAKEQVAMYNQITASQKIEVEITEEEAVILKDFISIKEGDYVSNDKWAQVFKAQNIIKNLLGFITWDDEVTEISKNTTSSAVLNRYRTLKSCDHEWKSYTGLNETFNYCKNCNKKQGEE